MAKHKQDEYNYEDYDDKAVEEEEEEEVVSVVEVERKPVPERRSTGLFWGGMAALAVLVCGAAYMLLGGNSFKTEDANKVIEAHQNYEMKAEKLDPTKVYSLSGAKDSLNKGSISIEKIQFRRDGTRLWIHVDNKGGNKINMMPGANSTLVDNNGHTYKADPFASQQVNGIAPGASEDIMLVYEPIRADAEMITFHLDMIFDMQNAAWQVAIPVALP